jgi:hypothetical protein
VPRSARSIVSLKPSYFNRPTIIDSTIIFNVRASGYERNFRDKRSGAAVERTGLDGMLEHVRPRNCAVMWRMNRLSRSVPKVSRLNIVLNGFHGGWVAAPAPPSPWVSAPKEHVIILASTGLRIG